MNVAIQCYSSPLSKWIRVWLGVHLYIIPLLIQLLLKLAHNLLISGLSLPVCLGSSDNCESCLNTIPGTIVLYLVHIKLAAITKGLCL